MLWIFLNKFTDTGQSLYENPDLLVTPSLRAAFSRERSVAGSK
jgi:hypothetical protein